MAGNPPHFAKPGIGSYVGMAIQQENLGAICWALLAMTVVIIIYDQLMFRPLVVWADNFRVEQTAALTPHRAHGSCSFSRHSPTSARAAHPMEFCLRRLLQSPGCSTLSRRRV